MAKSFKDIVRRTLVIVGIGIIATGCGATSSTQNAAQTTTVAAASPAARPSAATQPSATAAADIEQAQSALVNFFSALHGGRYTEASMLFGGSYEELAGYNPMVPADEHAQLLQNACTANGFQCLEIQSIINAKAVSATEFAFVVEFQNEDGSLFTRGPCCGASETAQPTQSQWSYTVEKVGDQFLVQELPVYVP